MLICGRRFLTLGYFVIFGLIAGAGFVHSEDGENSTTEDVTLCQFMERTKRTVEQNLNQSLHKWAVDCSILEDCNSMNCSAKFSGSELKGGFQLNLCKNPPSILFWKGPFWSHIFKADENSQRVEIEHQQNMAVTEGFPEEASNWFLTIHLYQRSKEKYVSLMGYVEICDQESKSPKESNSCSPTTLFNTTGFILSKICDKKISSRGIGMPSLLYAAPPSLDEIHAGGQRPLQSSSSRIGEACSTHDPFFCGDGGTCAVSPTSGDNGICECQANYENGPNGCVHVEPKPEPPSDVPAETSSSSAALGAVMSVIVLITLAGFIFMGTKYHIFARLRNRFHYVHCWPFRPGHRTIDHVSMVNPISSEDDEPPLL